MTLFPLWTQLLTDLSAKFFQISCMILLHQCCRQVQIRDFFFTLSTKLTPLPTLAVRPHFHLLEHLLISEQISSYFHLQGSHKLWKSWKTWKVTQKSSMHGNIMEFEKT